MPRPALYTWPRSFSCLGFSCPICTEGKRPPGSPLKSVYLQCSAVSLPPFDSLFWIHVYWRRTISPRKWKGEKRFSPSQQVLVIYKGKGKSPAGCRHAYLNQASNVVWINKRGSGGLRGDLDGRLCLPSAEPWMCNPLFRQAQCIISSPLPSAHSY